MTSKISACQNMPVASATCAPSGAKAGLKPACLGYPDTGGGPRQQVPGERRSRVNAWGMAGSALSKAGGCLAGARVERVKVSGGENGGRISSTRSPPSGDTPWRAEASGPEGVSPTARALARRLLGGAPARRLQGWLALERRLEAAGQSGLPERSPGC
jgi:hypothetical protein